MHLDQPLTNQFLLFLGNIANGTLGRQCPDAPHKPSVSAQIGAVFPYTLELAGAGMLVAVGMALPLGVVAAYYRGTWIDACATVLSLGGISIPALWLGPLLIFIFSITLGWLPGPAEPDATFSLLLPALVIGSNFMAMLARMTRSSLLDVLGEDYIQTARAKGLTEVGVVLKHGLRNALLPVVTVAGVQFGALLAGAIITEKIFARPGLGTLLYEAIKQRNFPVIQGGVLVIAVGYVAVNFLVDVTYGLVDPRIRHAE